MSKRKSSYHIDIDTYYGYNIPVSKNIDTVEDREQEEEYPFKETNTTWSITNVIEPINNNEDCDIACPFEVQEGQTYYAVYVIYHDGDSFTLNVNANLVFVDLFTTKEKAEELVDYINNHQTETIFEYLNETGQKRQSSAEWEGYFYGIGKCDISEVIGLNLNKKSRFTK